MKQIIKYSYSYSYDAALILGLQLSCICSSHTLRTAWKEIFLILQTIAPDQPIVPIQTAIHLHHRKKKKNEAHEATTFRMSVQGPAQCRVLIVSHLSGVKKAHIESWARSLARTRPLLTQHTSRASPSTITAFVPAPLPPPPSRGEPA